MELLHRRWSRSALGVVGASLSMAAGMAFAAPDISVRYVQLPPMTGSLNLTLSADGRYAAYRVATAGTSTVNIYVHDLIDDTRVQANLMATGDAPTAAQCDAPAMSGDARYVVFGCLSATMGSQPSMGSQSYYVYDRIHNKTEVLPTSNMVNRSGAVAISADGRYVAYRSYDAAGVFSLFVRDMLNKTTRTTTAKALTPIGFPALTTISADGRFVSYDGRPTPGASTSEVSIYDVSQGITETINVNTAGARGPQGGTQSTMSADGSVVAFFSGDPSLTTPPPPSSGGIIVRDRAAGKTELVSKGPANYPALSANGRYVAFVANPVPNVRNLYVYDRLTKVARSIPGAFTSNRAVTWSKFSADGRYLVFESTQYVPNSPSRMSIGVADLGAAAGLTVSTDPLSLTEGGAAGTYSIVLAQVPNADATVTISPDKQLSVARTKLVFAPDNWNVPQVVSVQALQDGVTEGKHSGVITHTVTSADIDYTVIKPLNVTVAINDAVVPTVVLPGATWMQSDLPVSGTAAPGANVMLTATNRSTGWLTSVSVLADEQGNWSRTLSGLSDGVIEIDAQADGIHSVVQSITVALLPPAPISLPPAQQ